jgi:DNA polymerase sigma
MEEIEIITQEIKKISQEMKPVSREIQIKKLLFEKIS